METETLSELEAFRDFLNERIEAGEVDASIDVCLDEWRRMRAPCTESIEAVREGLAEAKTGQGQLYREFLKELRTGAQATENE